MTLNDVIPIVLGSMKVSELGEFYWLKFRKVELSNVKLTDFK